MKKILISLILALTLSLALASCGEPTKDGTGPADTASPTGGEPVQKDVDLTSFYNALLEETEWPMMMPLEGEVLDGFYPGLSELSLKQCLVNTAAISSVVGEIALVETESAEDAQKAAEIFQARIDYQVGDETNPGGAWYPESIRGWQEDSHIVSSGNYVMLAVGDTAGDAAASFEALFA